MCGDTCTSRRDTCTSRGDTCTSCGDAPPALLTLHEMLPDATKDQCQGFVVVQVQRFDAGERQRYFADDDKQQLGDLVAQQRYEGAADIDANLADNIMRKGKRFRLVVDSGMPPHLLCSPCC